MKLVSLALLVLAFLTEQAFAEAAYRLKEKIEISGSTISLADLVDGPDVPGDPLFGAPAPGKTGTIKTARIIAAFKKATGKTLVAANDGAVTVTRRAKRIAESDIAAALTRQIARDFKIEEPEIRLQLDENANLAVDERSSGDIMIRNLRLDPQSLRFEAELGLGEANDAKADAIPLRGYVMADRLVPVITRAIEKGTPVTLDDVRMERRLRTSLAGKAIPALGTTPHQVALTALSIGDVVTDERVGKPQLVEKGAIVNVSYEANGLLLTMRGRATEGGAMGDVVSFTNPQSKKTLFGTVSGEGTLRVTASSMKEARLKTDATIEAQ
jgi:flagella basal body P-ring formation protein FlgA